MTSFPVSVRTLAPAITAGLLTVSLLPARAATVELISNGGFESGLTGWNSSLNVLALDTYFGLSPASGNSMAVVPAAGFLDAHLEQSIDTTSAVSATLTFDWRLAAVDITRIVETGTDSLTLSVGGQSLFTRSLNDVWDSSLNATTTAWETESIVLPTALLNNGPLSIRFEVENFSPGGGDPGQNFVAFVDNVSVQAVVPEVSSVAPFLAACGIGFWIRRRLVRG